LSFCHSLNMAVPRELVLFELFYKCFCIKVQDRKYEVKLWQILSIRVLRFLLVYGSKLLGSPCTLKIRPMGPLRFKKLWEEKTTNPSPPQKKVKYNSNIQQYTDLRLKRFLTPTANTSLVT
jgi:hypothetical protein